MIKIPRFLQEYANYKKRQLDSNSLMKPEYKAAHKAEIDTIVRQYSRGFIIIDEAIRMISDIP